MPKLGGQKPDYIVAALKAYRSGDRDFPTMHAIAVNLTDDEIDSVAEVLRRRYGRGSGCRSGSRFRARCSGTGPAPAPAAPAPAAKKK